jgi:hypothetical protein
VSTKVSGETRERLGQSAERAPQFVLTIDLETLALSWAISNTLAHQTSPLTWEKLIILDQI